ncbi:16S rRNA (guanine966-N2)-methyltransferase [Stackebrandtia albiflava]|uniref:16S rRNA (Guanine966-N2)-methyltransferase n=1 Tax=Stackebrandtia albiflava TaxID=406432 RepID=A0A562VAD3_9ACTN|nr:16S rRNA (guanine(966)-N(2))-methyltransferase RsmD [Stackebrandtia albiflava]TWJ14813.1 16S rRNA (guanine966-N2)-methyltransferase [Stackebrandtia albiflava]
MTRIIAGEHRGRRLATPAGDRTRPTSDRVREALFGALQATGGIEDAAVLDLYAGSGAVGLEAVSRGAAHVLMVEAHPGTARVIRRNIATLSAGDRAEVLVAELPQAVRRPAPRPFDLVFADPPYALPDTGLAEVLAALAANGWLAEDADVIVERSSRSGEPAWPPDVTGTRSRRYGESTLWYGRALWT